MFVIAEGLRTARSLRIQSLAVCLTVAASCVVSIATVGRSVEQEREILAVFDSSEARVVVFEPADASVAIVPGAVGRLERVNTVDWVIGVSAPFDVKRSSLPGAAPVAARYATGSSEDLRFSGDDPGAYVSAEAMRRLGLRAAAGAIEDRLGRVIPVEGSYSTSGALRDLNAFVLVRTSAHEDTEIRRFLVAATRTEDVPSAVRAGIAAIGVAAGDVAVTQNVALGEVRSVVAGTVGRYGRDLVVLALTITLALGALTMFASVAGRRKDFGRRRALGASRGDVITVVVSSATAAAAPGAVIGVVAGSTVLRGTTGQWPSPAFPCAVGLLAILTMVVAALPPAVVAAYQDPLRALRTP